MTIIIFDPYNFSDKPSHHHKVNSYIKGLFSDEVVVHHIFIKAYNIANINLLKFRKIRKVLYILEVLKALYKLIMIIENDKVSKVVIPNSELIILILVLMHRKIRKKQVVLRVRFICTVDSYLVSSPKLSKILFIFVRYLSRNSDKFSAETMEYCKYLTNLSGIEFDAIPYPSLYEYSSNPKTTNLISLLGYPRFDKGIDKLPEVIKYLTEIDSNVKFILQLGDIDIFGNELSEAENLTNIRILNVELSEEEFEGWLHESSAILFFYESKLFKYRGSGIASLALYAGIPMIYIDETAPSKEAERNNLAINLKMIGHGPLILKVNRQLGADIAARTKLKWLDFVN